MVDHVGNLSGDDGLCRRHDDLRRRRDHGRDDLWRRRDELWRRHDELRRRHLGCRRGGSWIQSGEPLRLHLQFVDLRLQLRFQGQNLRLPGWRRINHLENRGPLACTRSTRQTRLGSREACWSVDCCNRRWPRPQRHKRWSTERMRRSEQRRRDQTHERPAHLTTHHRFATLTFLCLCAGRDPVSATGRLPCRHGVQNITRRDHYRPRRGALILLAANHTQTHQRDRTQSSSSTSALTI